MMEAAVITSEAPIQFESNLAYPTDTTLQQQPLAFPDLQTSRCERITAQIIMEDGHTTQTVNNVLVQVRMRRQPITEDTAMQDDSSSSSSSSDDDDNVFMGDDNNDNTTSAAEEEQAFWIQRRIREAIYGNVYIARVLVRRPQTSAYWQCTSSRCAVKELNWQHIRRERSHLAEDPLQEVAAMAFLKQALMDDSMDNDASACMTRTHIIMPVAAWSDDRHLYNIMPYAAGGELFDLLDARNERFSEPEARYWMRQICVGLQALHQAGVCHRDLSLENLLVTETGTVVLIDLGMCIRHDRRVLVAPQGTCGKWNYMSPEIVHNTAFHGDTVDVWATGVILFLLLTGFPPWHRASNADDHYRYMSAGYLTQMLTEWQLGLSADAMDLLQRMLFADPADRLSLVQVQAHPWMIHPVVQAPQL